MGQTDSALICYQKSALLIEKDMTNDHQINQGYIRFWIGELLVAKEKLQLAEAFFMAAAAKWKLIFPRRATECRNLARQLRERINQGGDSREVDAEKVCVDWILGRDAEAAFR
jgi:hypothetical protein